MILQHNYDFGKIRGDIFVDELMAKHTSWKVGGPADIYFKPADKNDLSEFLKILSAQQKILWLGLGSNILIPDEGFRGVVINTVGKLKQIKINKQDETEKTTQINVEVGTTCAKFSREMAANGLLGGEFFAGIPGSMGGALAMNAGAFGGECWEAVKRVETINLWGEIKWREKTEFDVSYRKVNGLRIQNNTPYEWFLSADFIYQKDEKEVTLAKQKIKKMLTKRSMTQPTKLPNAGSVFKNPVGDFAARLIEQSGLKKHMIGGAQVSEKHANFIINTGDATATDIKQLIDHIKNAVAAKFKVNLETEVVIINNVD